MLLPDNFDELLNNAIKSFWQSRSSGSVTSQEGSRGAVIGGKNLDELISLFFLFPYVPTFVEILKIIIKGNIISGIHQHEAHIFIVTMFLLLDLLSSFFEDNQQDIVT